MLKRLRRDVSAVAALEDDLRQRMYLSIRAQGRPVSREEVASEVGVSRKLAAFHLDKLVDRGLLVATYARPPGRGGRGAGRSAKYYEPSGREFGFSIPERNYDVIGTVLLRAIEGQEPSESAHSSARRAAREVGEGIGRAERDRLRLPPPGAERTMAVATSVLSDCGYEPYIDDAGSIRMRSCPYHALAEQSRDLVCGMNRELVAGIVTGLGNETLDVALEPKRGECCVQLRAPRSRRQPGNESR